MWGITQSIYLSKYVLEEHIYILISLYFDEW